MPHCRPCPSLFVHFVRPRPEAVEFFFQSIHFWLPFSLSQPNTLLSLRAALSNPHRCAGLLVRGRALFVWNNLYFEKKKTPDSLCYIVLCAFVKVASKMNPCELATQLKTNVLRKFLCIGAENPVRRQKSRRLPRKIKYLERRTSKKNTLLFHPRSFGCRGCR